MLLTPQRIYESHFELIEGRVDMDKYPGLTVAKLREGVTLLGAEPLHVAHPGWVEGDADMCRLTSQKIIFAYEYAETIPSWNEW